MNVGFAPATPFNRARTSEATATIGCWVITGLPPTTVSVTHTRDS